MKKISLSFHNIILLFKILGKEQFWGLVIRLFSTTLNIFLPILLINYERKLILLIQSDNASENLLVLSIASLSIVLLFQKIFKTVFGFINSIINNKLSNTLEYTLYKKCVNTQLFVYDSHEIYDKMVIAKRIGSSTIVNYLSSFFEIIKVMIQFLSSSILLCACSFWLLLMAFLGAIPGIFLRRFGNKYDEFDKKRTPIVRRMNYFKKIATEGQYTKETKLFGMIPFICSEHKRYYDLWTKTELNYMDEDNYRRLFWQPITFLFTMILPSLFLIWRVSLYEIDVASFSYYLSLLALCHTNLNTIINKLFDNELADSRIEDYFAFMNMPINSREGKDIPSEWFEELPEIEFRNVSFSYNGSECYAINNVSFIIKPGEKVAILGLNGAGKTTLIKLLCGLYEPCKGIILIGGYNILDYSQVSLYRLFSVVFQDFTNFEAPLKESLSLGRYECAEYESIRHVFSMIDGCDLLGKRFNYNIDVPIGKVTNENGLELSGGELQKIVLARALLQERPMVIFDEPTASLDAYAESAILEKILSNVKKTMIIVTHRLSAVHFVDKIIVLENAKIIEQGSHLELMKKNGTYAHLYQIQAMEYNS